MTATDTDPTSGTTSGTGLRRETFESLNPATGEVVATFPVDDESSVRKAVDRAREAAAWWRDLGFDGRRRHLDAWRVRLTRGLEDLAEVVHRENGKPPADAILESALAVDHLHWAARNAPKVLGRHRVPTGLLLANHTAFVEYQPLGVIGVIGPWNYPVFTPMGSIIYALAAGNAVVFKPSEFTPAVGRWIVDSFAEAVPDHPVLQLVTGFGATGAALCRAGVDKVAFTGSTATAKKIMATCAETLTPVLAECGGKDALLVDADADLDAAADAAVWGGLSNAGQTCIGIERVYVHDAVYQPFVAKVTERASKLRPGSDAKADYGPMTMPGQVDVVRRHVEDALDRGGRAVVGGREAVRAPYVDPVVLTDVPEDSAAVCEETFGPTLVVNRVRDMDEGIERANGTGYGLGGAVFSASRGEQLAERMRAGMVSVNSAIAFAGVPALPFGGIGQSGFGRIHGADGLREFTSPRSIVRQRFAPPLNMMRFPRSRRADRMFLGLIRNLYGRR